MFLKNRCFFYCTNYTLSLIMFTIKVFSFYFGSVARLRYNAHLSIMAPSLCRIFFFTNSILIQSSPLRSTLFCSHVFSSKFFAIHLRKSACNTRHSHVSIAVLSANCLMSSERPYYLRRRRSKPSV